MSISLALLNLVNQSRDSQSINMREIHIHYNLLKKEQKIFCLIQDHFKPMKKLK